MVLFTKVTHTKITHSIDFQPYPICPNRIYFIAKGQVHQWHLENYTNEFEGYLIVFNESFIKSDKVLLDLFDFLNDKPFLDLNSEEIKIPIQLIVLITQYKKSENTSYQQSLIEALLYFLSSKKEVKYTKLNINQNRMIVLRKLIEQYYKNEKQVSFYAKKMNISAKRLNEVIQTISALSVSELIHQRVLLEAKRELALGTKTIQAIAYDLGYYDPSYFSRFFKKYEGVSPSQFMCQ